MDGQGENCERAWDKLFQEGGFNGCSHLTVGKLYSGFGVWSTLVTKIKRDSSSKGKARAVSAGCEEIMSGERQGWEARLDLDMKGWQAPKAKR